MLGLTSLFGPLVFFGSQWFLLGPNSLCWVLFVSVLGVTGMCLASLYYVILIFVGTYWSLLGLTGLHVESCGLCVVTHDLCVGSHCSAFRFTSLFWVSLVCV